ncbi:MAG: SurA N-terminal domain-containing protein, partial [Eubacteriales bacterium]|nr:SurA N-terminal domain-containing protein [Eubacteriales bacterium]
MNKKIVMIIAALIAFGMLFGACAAAESTDTSTAGAATDNDASVVIAEVNGNPIYKNAYDEIYDQNVSYLESAGYTLDEDMISDLKEWVMDTLISDEIFNNKMEELGYLNLTDEQLVQAEELAQEEIDSYIEYYFLETIEAELGEDYTDEELATAMDAYDQTILDSIMGMTWEELVEEYKDTVASEAAYDDLVGSIVPTEAEVKAKYDQYVEAYLADLEEDPTQYVYDALYGYTIYSTPEGVRKVRHI